MGRIIQIICGCVLALGLLAASQQPQDGDPGQSNQATNKVAPGTPKATPPERADDQPYNPPCRSGQDDRASDLCAQWKAADAAASGAAWGKSVGIATWIGVGLGFGTLVAAGLAAWFAKEAADHTADGATAAWATEKSARDANDISRNAWLAQTRPWLDLKLTLRQPPIKKDGKVVVELWLQAENVGAGPAHGVRLAHTVEQRPPRDGTEVIAGVLEASITGFLGAAVLFPGKRTPIMMGVDVAADEESMVPRLYACVRYKIAGSNKDHFTEMGFDVLCKRPGGGTLHLSHAPDGPLEIELSPTGGGLAS